MILHIKIAGIIMMLLSLIHVGFPQYFKWKKEFKSITMINRQMMYMHTLFLALAIFLISILCIGYTTELVSTHIGKVISKGLFIFWTFRLLIQFIGYSPVLWKGKLFETFIHILFTAIWLYFSGLFFMAGFL
ncbi:hypothetical protein O3P16_16995 [Chitinophagaceae bacterium LY-5]|uniref:Uncharacterized protein n=2 Tax=Polluticaenibacter yanchengensis TaxID=3014562 RepID=A0ABT4UNT6_9BACT|nr:hypothetical protein [Chitinophagaceae bacterium LY-5]